MVEFLEGDEIFFDVKNMLFFHFYFFYSINLISRLIYALENGSIATFTNFLQKLIVLEKFVLLDRLIALSLGGRSTRSLRRL